MQLESGSPVALAALPWASLTGYDKIALSVVRAIHFNTGEVIALNDREEVMRIREYAAGYHEDQLTLPKGAAEPGETLIEAANRELKEEIGFGARPVLR